MKTLSEKATLTLSLYVFLFKRGGDWGGDWGGGGGGGGGGVNSERKEYSPASVGANSSIEK